MYKIIEIIDDDDLGYPCKFYFQGVSVTEYGNININVTENPLSAQKFSIVENLYSKKSIFKIIKDVLKPKSVSVKTLEVVLK
jgi:hypothetical protein